MARPWSEAAALLAFTDCHPGAGRDGPIPPPRSIWSRLMSQSIDYAFLPRIDDVSRPTVCHSLDSLARHVDRLRRGQGILIEEIEDIRARRHIACGDAAPAPAGQRDRGVQIFALCLDGTRDRSLGFAWLKGGGREAIQAALTRVAPQGQGDRHLMQAA